MLNFFRKIRRKLIGEEEPSGVLPGQNQGEALTGSSPKREANLKKYLIYALGEILLVMVGILLALQVNNWNESRKNRQLQVKYLHNIMDELQEHTRLMERLVLSRYDRKMEGLQKVKLYANDQYQIKDTLGFLADVSYGAVFSNGMEFLSSSVFEELLNTGNIQLISNDSLKATISGHHHFVEKQILNVRYYVSDYQHYVNSLRAFNRNNPDSISHADQLFMLKNLKSDETIKNANREISYGNQVNYLVTGINRRTKELIERIQRELESL